MEHDNKFIIALMQDGREFVYEQSRDSEPPIAMANGEISEDGDVEVETFMRGVAITDKTDDELRAEVSTIVRFCWKQTYGHRN